MKYSFSHTILPPASVLYTRITPPEPALHSTRTCIQVLPLTTQPGYLAQDLFSRQHRRGCCRECLDPAGKRQSARIRVRKGACTYDREHAAASTLADGRADSAEVGRVGRDIGSWNGQQGDSQGSRSLLSLTSATVEVSNTEDVGGAALGRAVEAAAGDVELALLDLRGQGRDEADAHSEDGSGELHLGSWVGVVGQGARVRAKPSVWSSESDVGCETSGGCSGGRKSSVKAQLYRRQRPRSSSSWLHSHHDGNQG